jgi:hypothetical protein
VAFAASYGARLEVLCFGAEQTEFDYPYLGLTGRYYPLNI